MSWRNRVWAVYLAIAGALMLTYLFFPPLAGNGPLINVLGLSGVVAIVVGIRMHRPRARAAWWLFVVGQFLFWAGDIYTYSYRILFGADVPFPSVGDALYLAVYPALMVGLVLLVKRRNPKRDRSALIDAAILTLGVGLLSWVFLIAPNIHLTGLTWLQQAVSVAYPLGDVLLLAAVIRQHRLPARHGLRVQLRAPEGHVQPQAARLRRRLDPLLPPLGRGRAPSLHADPRRGARARRPHPAHAAPADAARRRVPDRARDSLRRGAR